MPAKSPACGRVIAPVPVYSPDPPYSDEARKARFSGSVMLQIIVDTTSNVRSATLVEPLGLGLDEKAVETIRTWRFKPARRNRVPVNVRMRVQVSFSLFSPAGCKIPVAVASQGPDDPSKISWRQIPSEFIQWWLNKGGSRQFPSVCIVPSLNDGAVYALYVQQHEHYPGASTPASLCCQCREGG